MPAVWTLRGLMQLSAWGGCAKPHVTADSRKRKGPKNFQCAICNGPHEAWDNVCNIRQHEVHGVRLATASRLEFHPEPGSNPGALQQPMDDIRSRGFASTRRYSGDYLIHVTIRGGRKLHAKLRGRGGRGQCIPEFREIPESVDRESVPLPGKSTGHGWNRNGKAPFDSDRYSVQAAARAGFLKVKPGDNQVRPETDLCKARTLAGPQRYDHDGTRSIEESAMWSQAAIYKWQFH